ncbi:MAG: hypothetical protein AAF732_17840 [Pseudomonadota bacterium]
MERFSVITLAAWLIAGCASLTPSGLLTAAAFNPLRIETATLRAAVVVPHDVGLTTGDLVLTLSFTPSDGTAPIAETFVLRVSSDIAPDELNVGANEAVFVARLTPTDAARFQATQSRILKRREQVTGKGSFSVTVGGACSRTGRMPAKLPLRTFMSSNAQPFVELSRHADVLADLGKASAGNLRAQFRTCPVGPVDR